MFTFTAYYDKMLSEKIRESDSVKKTSILLLSVILVFSLFAGCDGKQAVQSAESIQAIYPVDCSVSLHTEKQDKYFTKKADKLPFGINGKKENSRPEAVQLRWEYGVQETEFTVSLSKSENMQQSVTYTVTGQELALYNLELDTEYYWTVSADGKTSGVASFTTDGDAPRFIYADGITNVRDIGGWITESGIRTRQGLIYRCGRLNESEDNGCAVMITEDGRRALVEQLGIRTELDLRQVHTGETGGITSSPLGDEVKYISCSIDWSGNVHGDNKEQILEIFRVLSDQDNYPMLLHCSVGTDRTGMISFLLNALLGVPEDDLFRDYMFSNFAAIGSKRKLSQLTESQYYIEVKNASGETLSEKAYSFLADIGVPEQQLDAIISNFTGQ